MNRRGFLAVSAVSLFASSLQKVVGQELSDVEVEGPAPPLPADLIEFANEPPAPYTELAGVGTGQPTSQEITVAYDILLSSPYNTDHLSIANYFLALQGDQAQFKREWPVRANPLIYHFFSATETKPEGDVTAWCAASINWFLLRAKATSREEIGRAPGPFSTDGKPFSRDSIKKYATNNASSGSFRCWPDINREPTQGDLLVLADAGTGNLTKYCRGSGHITIFNKRIDGTHVECIGGNQSQKGSNGAITRAIFNVGPGSRFLKFVSSVKA
ncbi:hypothetical protein ACCS95_33665 [Rhizobium ruizarguesonis]